ncbi:hypothetical protein B0H16DRAFT_1796489 [Mycena metata]|uniref:Uncharacterized protein n=1 Tax=Mycena metata TaxID=1033252 RepID=A0AAD7NL13_9AGAR|nr:hypothetical protein B0H16DRAFT_1796489 [Mycena metata]
MSFRQRISSFKSRPTTTKPSSNRRPGDALCPIVDKTTLPRSSSSPGDARARRSGSAAFVGTQLSCALPTARAMGMKAWMGCESKLSRARAYLKPSTPPMPGTRGAALTQDNSRRRERRPPTVLAPLLPTSKYERTRREGGYTITGRLPQTFNGADAGNGKGQREGQKGTRASTRPLAVELSARARGEAPSAQAPTLRVFLKDLRPRFSFRFPVGATTSSPRRRRRWERAERGGEGVNRRGREEQARTTRRLRAQALRTHGSLTLTQPNSVGSGRPPRSSSPLPGADGRSPSRLARPRSTYAPWARTHARVHSPNARPLSLRVPAHARTHAHPPSKSASTPTPSTSPRPRPLAPAPAARPRARPAYARTHAPPHTHPRPHPGPCACPAHPPTSLRVSPHKHPRPRPPAPAPTPSASPRTHAPTPALTSTRAHSLSVPAHAPTPAYASTPAPTPSASPRTYPPTPALTSTRAHSLSVPAHAPTPAPTSTRAHSLSVPAHARTHARTHARFESKLVLTPGALLSNSFFKSTISQTFKISTPACTDPGRASFQSFFKLTISAALVVTARSTSINIHLGVEQARHNDLESLAYVLTYFWREGWILKYVKSTKASTDPTDLTEGSLFASIHATDAFEDEDDTARRARETGRVYRGGEARADAAAREAESHWIVEEAGAARN